MRISCAYEERQDQSSPDLHGEYSNSIDDTLSGPHHPKIVPFCSPFCQSDAAICIPIEPHCVLRPQWKALKLVYLNPAVPMGSPNRKRHPILRRSLPLAPVYIYHTPCVPAGAGSIVGFSFPIYLKYSMLNN